MFTPDQSGQAVIPQASSVPSPCIRNCCLDEDDVCLGCFRSLDEVIAWGNTDNGEKRRILSHAARRKQDRTAND
ncbi:MAG: hypothetical protein BMS9Abin09_1017 [Gammaproteobacteria bacterium]|nr:MAG: hypothetical protein BMS9Abin09_1017 [Gammaproteobacteria bacterium]